MVAELDTASGRVVRSYVWGLDVTGSLTAAGGVGALLMETVHTTTSLSAFHVVSDGNGNVGALVSLTGAVGAAYEYGPFGENVRTQTFDAANLADQPFRFSTKFTDVETSLVYYGYRFYSPSLGRFICRDPAGEVGGHNLYAFVGNSPIDRWDYLGMWSFKELFSNFFNLFSQDHSEGARTTPAEVESENEKESIFAEPNNGRKLLHLPDGSAADEDGKEWVYLTGANDRGTNGKWHKSGNSAQKSPNGTKANTATNNADRTVPVGLSDVGAEFKKQFREAVLQGGIFKEWAGAARDIKAQPGQAAEEAVMMFVFHKASEGSFRGMLRSLMPGNPRVRGNVREDGVLERFGFRKNNRTVSTTEGDAIPDALERTVSVEVKDTKVVSATRQIRIETDAARTANQDTMLFTGVNTHVSEPARDRFDVIIRLLGLGPD